jgi:hypothetical protein
MNDKKLTKMFEKLYQNILSEKIKERIEKVILSIAIASFVIHLLIIYFIDLKFVSLDTNSNLLTNPIAAIYTPFSFILLYEVYLLIYYLPKSFTKYVSKQYEIMSLIIVRRLFKDLSNLRLSGDWFNIKYDLQFSYDLATSLLMFFLIYLFYLQSEPKKNVLETSDTSSLSLMNFIKIKKMLALLLVPIFISLSIYSFTAWVTNMIYSDVNSTNSFLNINNIFFEQFFNILIFADVLLLLFSFYLTHDFHKVMRNSGFIISTILIRISFSTTGLVNNLLIICAIVYGLFIIIIHNKFEKKISTKNGNQEI